MSRTRLLAQCLRVSYGACPTRLGGVLCVGYGIGAARNARLVGGEEYGMTGRGQGWYARLLSRALLVVALLALTSLLAACGVGADNSGGSNYSLGLAGSTLDHASNPPTIAANGPGGTYAFVYDNQIWLRQDGQANAKQITRIPLSNAAYIAWGPLVWSPQGKYIAFALVQDLAPAPGSPPSSSGPIYYVDTTSCAGDGQYCAVYSAGTGSIYGHTYDWLGESALVYSSGDGVMLYMFDRSARLDGAPNPQQPERRQLDHDVWRSSSREWKPLLYTYGCEGYWRAWCGGDSLGLSDFPRHGRSTQSTQQAQSVGVCEPLSRQGWGWLLARLAGQGLRKQQRRLRNGRVAAAPQQFRSNANSRAAR